MKRYRALASCCMAAACMAALLAVLTGCTTQQSYTPPEKTATLSAPAIGRDGTLRVGVNTGNQPLAGQPNSSSKIVGIDVDVAAALADSFGLKLEIVDVGTDAETAIKDGRVDIVMGIDKSEADATFWKSDAYLPTAVALFSTASNAAVPANAADVKIAAQVSSKSAWAVTNEFDKSAITTTEDLKSAFAELASGQVQYVAADALIGTYAAHTAGDDVHIVALMQQPSGYCIGVSDANTDLKQAVSEALSTLVGNGVIGVVETKWLGTALDLSATPLTAGASKSSGDASGQASVTTPAAGADAAAGDAAAPAEADAAAGGEGEAAPAGDAAEGAGDASTAGENAVQPEDIAA